MTDLERKRLQTEFRRDQSWAMMAEHTEDADRIAEHGPDDTPNDALIVKMLAALVSGDLYYRAGLRKLDDIVEAKLSEPDTGETT